MKTVLFLMMLAMSFYGCKNTAKHEHSHETAEEHALHAHDGHDHAHEGHDHAKPDTAMKLFSRKNRQPARNLKYGKYNQAPFTKSSRQQDKCFPLREMNP